MSKRRRGNLWVKLLIVIGLTVVGGLVATRLSIAQPSADVHQRVAIAALRLQDQDWHTREVAFYELLKLIVPGGLAGQPNVVTAAESGFVRFFGQYPDLKNEVTSALVNLMDRESVLRANAALGSLPEEFGDYEGDLIAALKALHDPRASDVLVGELSTGNMAATAVAARGGYAVDRVLAVLSTADIGARIGATRTLGHMLDPAIATLDAGSRAKVKTGLLQAAKDPHFAVRLAAVDSLAKMPDTDVTGVLMTIRERDAYKRLDGTYPVRDAARRVLASR